MPEKRVKVWVQRFNDRPHLMLQWIDPDSGKRKSRSAGTADEAKAERARADLEYELNNGLHHEQTRMSWKKFRGLFTAEYLPGCREGTRRVYDNVFNLFERLCNPGALRSITARTVSGFVAALRKEAGRGGGGPDKKMMPSTIKARLQFLHTALAWAVEQKLLAEVPAFPAVKVPKKKPQAVPEEAFERLLAGAPDAQTRAFLLSGWLAGLRRNEALALEWGESATSPWVDFGRSRIILPAELVKADADQWVALDPDLRAALEAVPRQGPKVFRFVSKATGEELTTSGVSLIITELAREAGVKLSMKSLRRGFGCRYAGRVPAQVLQKIMRHANIRTTMDYYANVDDAAEQAILGRERNARRNGGAGPAEEADGATDATPGDRTTFG